MKRLRLLPFAIFFSLIGSAMNQNISFRREVFWPLRSFLYNKLAHICISRFSSLILSIVYTFLFVLFIAFVLHCSRFIYIPGDARNCVCTTKST